MDEGRASLTALATSLMRAVHTRMDEAPLIDDPWGERLVLESEREVMRAAARATAPPDAVAGIDPSSDDFAAAAMRAQPVYGTVIVRTRFAEDALQEAVVRGASQYVIVGAGMDSFALRRPDWARDLEVFEVDHPATQGFKRDRLDACGVEIPSRTQFIAADLGREPLDEVLARSAFSPDETSFFSWLGVTTYLTREANLATLSAIARAAAAGSGLVFTYIDQREFESADGSDELAGVRSAAASMGEPWVSGFHPARLADDLRSTGLELVEDLAGAALGDRYCAGRTDGLCPSASVHIARARVLG
jgi:methyltransferase (TIGR00027 family)